MPLHDEPPGEPATKSPGEKAVLSYQAPTPAPPPLVTRGARIGAGVATAALLALAAILWRDRAVDASLMALAGATFCLLVALGLVKTRPGGRR